MKQLFTKASMILLVFSSAVLAAQPATNWWNKTVFYELMVRSFYDSNGDGIGDFNGLTSKLDYLNDGDSTTNTDLGIKGIWLMPINASPSYHGYDVTDYKAVNSKYGTNVDFKNMVTEAHKRGIKVIIDFVINHSSSQHPWFTKAASNDPKYREFYRWSSTIPTYKGPWGQNLWYPKSGSNYYALFWDGMPDLNYNHPPVKDSIYSAAKFWLETMSIDGFRLDAAMYLYENGSDLMNRPETVQFWTDFTAYCKTINPDAMTVGEVWESSANIKKYNGKLDNCFEFNVATGILNAFKNGNTSDLISKVKYAYDSLKYNQFGTFLTNHDQMRAFDEMGGNLSKLKAAASTYLTLPGNPYLYYGEEIGMTGVKPDEKLRSPMQWSAGTRAGFTTGNPWQAINSNFTTYNVQTLDAEYGSIFNHYKRLIKIRNNFPAIQTGSYLNVISNNNAVFSYTREAGNEKFLILINTSSNNINNLSLNMLGTNYANQSHTFTNLLNYNYEQLAVNNATGSGINLSGYEAKILYLGELTANKSNFVEPIINVYPNPTVSGLTFEVKYLGASKEFNIMIYNALGEVKYKQMAKSNTKITISTDGFAAGIYYIKAGNGQSVKFEKQ
jgi:alpha-amylase